MLNRLDEALETAIKREPSLLLIQPSQQPSVSPSSLNSGDAALTTEASATRTDEPGTGDTPSVKLSASLEKTERLVLACLQFLAVVMRNCLNKQIFSSSEVRNSQDSPKLHVLVRGGLQ